ncbi:MAG: ABC transporter substrate-binding protein [Acidimicrobiia bacterium]|nr:ABC transporter substrate-binding protein [Acidimicrobiia bacterium]
MKERVRPMRINRSGVLGATVLALALLAAACGSGEDAVTDGPTITIGSANFSENALVAEIYAQVLEDKGYSIERNLNVGARDVYGAALESGELDLVPEYVGSALSFKGGTPTADSAATAQDLRDAWEADGITVLDPAPAQDKNGIVVRQDTADALGLSKVSDLAAHPDLIFGGPPECPEREFCLIGLQDVYGLSFAEFKPLDVGGALTVAALEGDEIQVALLFTSDGVIAAKGFVLLEDDQGLQPAENLTPVIRQEIVDAYGDALVDALNEVSAELTTTELSEMNRRIGIDGDDPEQVAADWISENL